MLDLTKSEPLKIIIGSPVGENIKPGYMLSLDGVMGSLDPDEVRLRKVPCAGSNIAENQNCIVDAAEEKSADYIFLVESDMAFPFYALKQLLSHEKDIVGCTYPYKDRDLLARRLRGEDVTFRYMGHELGATSITLQSLIQGEALRKVEFIPMGLVLISMRAIRLVREQATKRLGSPNGKLAPAFFHNVAFPEDRPRGIVSTTDATFCGEARDAGLDIWLDARLSLQVEHIGDCAYGLIPDEQGNPVKALQDQVQGSVDGS